MKIALLIQGYMRSFLYNLNILKDFLVNHKVDLYIYLQDDESNDQYVNPNIDLEDIKKIMIPNKIIYDDSSSVPNYDKNMNQKEINMFELWRKRYLFFLNIRTELNEDYDLYMLMRPDICILNDYDYFENIISNIDDKLINIPVNHDYYNTSLIDKKYKYMNDHMVITNYDNIEMYCKLYEKIDEYVKVNPIISEVILYYHLEQHNMIDHISRIGISYKLLLSECNIIGIAGDSGSGKSTFAKLLRPLFDNNKLLEIEGDMYHKWERGNVNWSQYTHLNPYANNLSKMHDDLFTLKLGDSVHQVEYDHKTGKFTYPKQIESKENIILCGLHSFYNKRTKNLVDLKVFIDTEERLRVYWKIKRDQKERKYTIDQVIDAINDRKKDQHFINSQKESADIIINYYTDIEIDMTREPNINAKMVIRTKSLIDNMSNKLNVNNNDDALIIYLDENVNITDELEILCEKYNLDINTFSNNNLCRCIQYIFLLIIYR